MEMTTPDTFSRFYASNVSRGGASIPDYGGFFGATAAVGDAGPLGFWKWLESRQPQLYAAVAKGRPDLVAEYETTKTVGLSGCCLGRMYPGSGTKDTYGARPSLIKYGRFNPPFVVGPEGVYNTSQPFGFGLRRNGLGDATTDAGTATDVATGASTAASDWQNVVSQAIAAASQIIPAYGQYQLTKGLIDINLARAQQGLPPVDASTVTPGVTVGVDKTTLMIVAGIGVFAIWAVTRKGRR